MGQTQAALDAFIPTLYDNFHSMDEAFVSVLVDEGNPLAAVLLATARIRVEDAPVGLWINALQNPNQDHSAALGELDQWMTKTGKDIAYEYPDFLLALKDYERAAQSPLLRFSLFGPGSRDFRRTPWFKQYVRARGYETYWRNQGFPPNCRSLGEQDFECD